MDKKTILLILTLCIIGDYTIAQNAIDDQKKGGTIEQMTEAIQRNNDITIRNMEVIKSIPGLIEEQYKRQTGSIIVGTTIGMLLIYFVVAFFDRLRLMKNKKSHEEYIRNLKEENKAIFNKLDENTKENKKLVDDMRELIIRLKPLDKPLVMEDKKVLNKLVLALVSLGVLGLIKPYTSDIVFLGTKIVEIWINLVLSISIIIGLRLWFMGLKMEVK